MSERAEADLLLPDDTAGFISAGRSDDHDRTAVVERSCCCPSRPTVRVLVPSATDPASRIDLLLCGHHYRASRTALIDVRASVAYIGADLS
jgi:hypothetical protein